MTVAKTPKSTASAACVERLEPESAESNLPKRTGRTKAVYSRAELVGKFPNIKHQPAPKARCRLSEETRNQLLSRMLLV